MECNDNKQKIRWTIEGGYDKDKNKKLGFDNLWLEIKSDNKSNENVHCCKKILNKILPCCFT
tara:strand:+ start:45 stop:230 length:186 start_codon:yes stop_codon:yes gene_type:complete